MTTLFRRRVCEEAAARKESHLRLITAGFLVLLIIFITEFRPFSTASFTPPIPSSKFDHKVSVLLVFDSVEFHHLSHNLPLSAFVNLFPSSPSTFHISRVLLLPIGPYSVKDQRQISRWIESARALSSQLTIASSMNDSLEIINLRHIPKDGKSSLDTFSSTTLSERSPGSNVKRVKSINREDLLSQSRSSFIHFLFEKLSSLSGDEPFQHEFLYIVDSASSLILPNPNREAAAHEGSAADFMKLMLDEFVLLEKQFQRPLHNFNASHSDPIDCNQDPSPWITPESRGLPKADDLLFSESAEDQRVCPLERAIKTKGVGFLKSLCFRSVDPLVIDDLGVSFSWDLSSSSWSLTRPLEGEPVLDPSTHPLFNTPAVESSFAFDGFGDCKCPILVPRWLFLDSLAWLVRMETEHRLRDFDSCPTDKMKRAQRLEQVAWHPVEEITSLQRLFIALSLKNRLNGYENFVTNRVSFLSSHAKLEPSRLISQLAKHPSSSSFDSPSAFSFSFSSPSVLATPFSSSLPPSPPFRPSSGKPWNPFKQTLLTKTSFRPMTEEESHFPIFTITDRMKTIERLVYSSVEGQAQELDPLFLLSDNLKKFSLLFNAAHWQQLTIPSSSQLVSWRALNLPLHRQVGKPLLPERTAILWSMECGLAASLGFTMESITTVLSLDALGLPISIRINNHQACFEQLSRVGIAFHALFRLYKLSQIRWPAHTDLILVLHHDPGRFLHFLPNPPESNQVFFTIGRSMFETDRIPSHWFSPCLTLVDEIWVPSRFNLGTFSLALSAAEESPPNSPPPPLSPSSFTTAVSEDEYLRGVLGVFPQIERELEEERVDRYTRFSQKEALEADLPFSNRIRVIPEGVDSHFYAPSTESDDRHNDDGDSVFTFLSVMKWEKRKGWDVLVSAFIKEFDCHKDKVRLVFRSNLDNSNEIHLQELINKTVFDTNLCVPEILVLDEPISLKNMPRLYQSADAFVLATRGEGWGLPIMEALASGIPVICLLLLLLLLFLLLAVSLTVDLQIATNWSAMTDYLTQQNSLLISVESLENAEVEGHLWALPSEDSLRSQMRRAYSMRNSTELRPLVAQVCFLILSFYDRLCKARGLFTRKRSSTLKKAREDIVKHFDLKVIARKYLSEFQRIAASKSLIKQKKECKEEEGPVPVTSREKEMNAGSSVADDHRITGRNSLATPSTVPRPTTYDSIPKPFYEEFDLKGQRRYRIKIVESP